MSLVSVITNYGQPVVVSDIAISTEEKTDEINVPALNRKVDFNKLGSGKKIYSYGLKILIIQDILCVTFAGNVADIKDAQANIEDFFLYRYVNVETLQNLFKEYHFSHYKDLSISFTLGRPEISKNTVTGRAIGKWEIKEHPFFEKVISSGSGAKEWNEKFYEQSNLLQQGEKVFLGDCLNKVLLTCAYFLWQEKISPENLLEGWGGGFDVAYYDGCHFKKIENVVFAFFSFDISKPNTDTRPQSFIHNSYDDKKLIIRYFDQNDHKTYVIKQFNDKIIDTSKTYSLLVQSNLVVSCVQIFNGSRKTHDFFIVNPKTEKIIFQTMDIDGILGIGIESEYENTIKTTIKDFLS